MYASGVRLRCPECGERGPGPYCAGVRLVRVLPHEEVFSHGVKRNWTWRPSHDPVKMVEDRKRSA